MDITRDKWALVTGASQGIGLELARCFAKDGINLVLVARSGARLHELEQEWTAQYQIKIMPIKLDLSVERAPENLYELVKETGIRISFLVNNAGIGLYGKYQETDIEREHQMIMLNCLALTRLTKLFLEDMLKDNHGNILNLASTASFQPGPYQAVYFATKAYVLSYSEAIAEDLKTTGIKVTALCPGLTASGFIDHAEMGDAGFVKRSGVATAESVAQNGYNAMRKGKRITVHGLINWFSALIPRFVPRRLVTLSVAMMMRPIQKPEVFSKQG
jgi:short-subunit dehydrogenase